MAKVGKFVIDPKLGAYCQITLDDGKKILVNHEKGEGQSGRMMVTEKKFWGGETFLDVRLETPDGKSTVARLTAGAAADSPRATPLGALVEALQGCATLEEVRARCLAIRGGGG